MKKWRNVEITTVIYHGSTRRKYGWHDAHPDAKQYLAFMEDVAELAERHFPGRTVGSGRFYVTDEDGNES